MDHSGALAHSAYCHCFSADLKLNCRLFFYGICCHNGFRCLISCFQASVKLRRHSLYAGCKLLNRKLHSDDTCGSHKYAVRIHFKGFCCCQSSFPATFKAFFSRTCIGDPAVADDHLSLRLIIHNILIPFYRSRLNDIGGKGSCCLTGNLTVYHCHISSSLIFDPGSRRSCLKSFCRCHAACNDIHNNLLLLFSCSGMHSVFPVSEFLRFLSHTVPAVLQRYILSYGTMGIWRSPSASSKPNIRFIF